MNRRKFMVASLSTILASKYVRAENFIKNNNYNNQNLSLNNNDLKFGSLSIQKLYEEYHSYLFNDFIPFMDKYVIDKKYGGFLCNTNLNGININTNKAMWTEGRGIWVYSFLYNNFGKDEKYLTIARNSLNLILKTKPDNNNLWTDQISREGIALTPPSKVISGDILIAEGLCEYSRATGERKYWNMAKEIIIKCWKIYNDKNYHPNIVADYQGPKVIPFPGAKIQGVSMLMIVTINQMLELQDDPDLEAIISECTDSVITKFYNPEFQLNNELLNHDYSRPNNELAQFVYTGIAIETLWPIMERAVKLKDVELFQRAAERFKRHVEVAWDDVYGGIFRSLNNVELNLWETETLSKVLWAQEEVLNGIILLIEQIDDEWAKNLWFEKMHKYLTKKFLLKQYNYPLWIFAADRKVTFNPSQNNQTIENYHLPRNLMFTILAIERIIKNNGKPLWPAAKPLYEKK